MLPFVLMLSTLSTEAMNVTVSDADTGMINATESDLYAHFFTDNNLRDTLPINVANEPLTCSVHVSLISLLKVDSTTEQLELHIGIAKEWYTGNFAWDSEKWNNITEFTVPTQNVWLPDIEVATSISVKTFGDQYVRIFSDGWLSSEVLKIVKVSCTFDMTYFPFDTQVCLFLMGSNRYKFKQLTFKQTEQVDKLWIIKRNSQYYVTVILVPTFLIVTISLIGMFSPHASSGEREEKVSFGLGTLLAMSVMLSVVAEQSPKTSGSLPLLAKFVLSEIVIVTIAIAVTVAIVYVHERALRRRALPPRWLCRILALCELNKDGSATLSLALRNTFDPLNTADPADDASGKYTPAPEMRRVLEILRKISDEIDAGNEKDERAAQWQQILRRLDLALMILFQILNIVIGLVVLLPAITHTYTLDEWSEMRAQQDTIY